MDNVCSFYMANTDGYKIHRYINDFKKRKIYNYTFPKGMDTTNKSGSLVLLGGKIIDRRG